MRKYLKLGIAVLVLGLIVGLTYVLNYNKTLSNKWKIAEENVKSYSELLSSTENKNRGYKLTIDQLKYSQDSIIKELNTTRKELGIKDSKLKSLQYASSTFSKTDTLTINDTIFKDYTVKVDTLLSDEWYSLNIKLQYPSQIAITPVFKSKKYIIVSSRRETVNPPKKFFLLRWFQKKHTVLNIDVVEKNPYVKDENNRYVEIIN